MDDFLVKKIKGLRQIKPNTSWLQSQRSFLLSEISQGKKHRKPSLVLPLFNFNILKLLQPNFAIALVVIILISSLATVGAISASQNSLPGDFLYPVKTAFEKTQLTFAPGEANKTKLSIKFANQRIDEFTQLIDKSEKKEDIEKTVENLKTQLTTAKENIDKLREKNIEKATEVAKIVKAQTSIYEETLIKGSEQLAYALPEDKEDLKEEINQAVEINKALKETSEELTSEESTQSPEEIETSSEGLGGEVLVPEENVEEGVESPSVDFEDLQDETVPQEEIQEEE